MTMLAVKRTPDLDFESPSWEAGVSQASDQVRHQWGEALTHYYATPISRLTMADVFHDLVATWREERAFASSVDAMVLTAAYQRIISLGSGVVPLILREMEARPDHWFWALWVLTDADPVPDEKAGDVLAMTNAWLEWGKAAGFLT